MAARHLEISKLILLAQNKKNDVGASTRARGLRTSHHGSWKISPHTSLTPDRHSNVRGPCSGKRLLFVILPPPLALAPSHTPPIAVEKADGRGSSQDALGKDGVTDEVTVGTGVQAAGGGGVSKTDDSDWPTFGEWPSEITVAATPAVTAPAAAPR